MTRSSRPPVERASSNDLMQLATDAAGVPAQVGGLLILAPVPGPTDWAAVADALRVRFAERIPSVPRLRQRLLSAPFGCGRRFWVDDAAFDLGHHFTEVTCAAPGDAAALLRVGNDLVNTPLPRDRPLWSATFVTGLASGEAALVIVFHHVLADGIGGLAVLGALIDAADGADATVGAAEPSTEAFPRPAPTTGDLVRDAVSSRRTSLRAWRSTVRQLGEGIRELRTAPRVDVPRSSLNVPLSRRRSIAVARAPLAPLLASGRAQGAKFNDVVLAAIGAALADLLARRGETVDQVVASVPVSARREAGSELGNQVGAFPVPVPLTGSAAERLKAIADITRTRSAPSGASAALLEPLFRGLAALHLLRWFVERQHLVNTFVTNLHGPDERLRLVGHEIRDLIAVSISEGNVTLAFTVLSYAGTVNITVVADPAAVTPAEHALVVSALERHLGELSHLPANRVA